MSPKSTRRGISAAPPAVPDEGAEAFVKGAAVHVVSSSPAAAPPVAEPPAVAKPGRPRKHNGPMKPLTIRVSLDCYEDLRFLEYVQRKGSIQEVAAELLGRAAKEAREKVEK